MARVRAGVRVGVASTVVAAAVIVVVAVVLGGTSPARLANGVPACTTGGLDLHVAPVRSATGEHAALVAILVSNVRGRCDLVGAPAVVAVTGEDLRPYTAPLGAASSTTVTELAADTTVELTANVPTCPTANPRHLAINETTGLEVRLGSASAMTFYAGVPIDLVCAGARIPVTSLADARPASVTGVGGLVPAVPVGALVRTR